MTGLDLESFLLLLRADLTTWAVLALMGSALAGLVWFSWGSRRALRKCLVASLVAHTGLAYYARSVPAIGKVFGGQDLEERDRAHIRKIQVLPVAEQPVDGKGPPGHADSGIGGSARRPLDQTIEPLALADSRAETKQVKSPEAARDVAEPAFTPPKPIPLTTAIPPPRIAPMPALPVDGAAEPMPKAELSPVGAPALAAPVVTDLSGDEIPAAVLLDAPKNEPEDRGVGESLAAVPDRSLRGGTGRRASPADPALPEMKIGGERPPIPLTRATPRPAAPARDKEEGLLADLVGALGNRPLQEVPSVYRPRLDPNRSVAAKRAGASDASEQAVERALDWLARHQDDDGRWDGGTARDVQGNAVDEDDDFTVHCPAGQTCFGECIYWEADTAVTGLALLTFLGSGYTQMEGRHSVVVENGLQFLIRIQKPDGDLRGRSKAVGMYCHAMAALALCEAYALTGDERLREPVTRAVAFAVTARAKDREAWRYAPGAPVGDTSILGWVVMLFKSARESRIRINDSEDIQRGILKWLDRVASGESKGLARYQEADPVTPTMTAEAWVCRQFLGEGGPGPASDEAAEYLLKNPADRGKTNFYYSYYATLALYQHGGEQWGRWNARTRDRLVGLQRTAGHQAGSWDPDDSIYGVNGGRIYCTAMAALTLEVYYRYLRLYDRPSLPSDPESIVPLTTPDAGPRLRPPR